MALNKGSGGELCIDRGGKTKKAVNKRLEVYERHKRVEKSQNLAKRATATEQTVSDV